MKIIRTSTIVLLMLIGAVVWLVPSDTVQSVDAATADALKGRGCNGYFIHSRCNKGKEIQGNWFFCPGQPLYNKNANNGPVENFIGDICYIEGFGTEYSCGIFSKAFWDCNGKWTDIKWLPVQ